SNFENWEQAGAIETPWRANRIFKEVLAQYQPPPMDPGAREELEAFVVKRKSEGGAPTDF
ncbi:MAG TPA: methyltransferase, partial [Gammaproteobacteria bacterium]|nr:methyltransferase [Gammaproteobacteria bacterium]